MLENFVTTLEAVEVLAKSGIKRSQRHIAGLCAKGEFPNARKMGKTWLIPITDLKIYILSHPAGRHGKVRSFSFENNKGDEVHEVHDASD